VAAKAVSTGRSRRGWSFYGTWRSCPRKWAFIYLEGRDPIVNGGPLAIGTMVHELLAATLLKRMGQEAHATDARIEAKVRDTMGLDDDGAELAKRVSREWRAATLSETDKPIAVEKEYAIRFVPLKSGRIRKEPEESGRGVLFTHRVDATMEDLRGGIWFDDHKTTWDPQAAALDYGMSGSHHGDWHLGRFHFPGRFRGPRLNFLRKGADVVSGKRRPAAAPRMVEEFPQQLVTIAREITHWRKRTRDPWEYPRAGEAVCTRDKWGHCPFLDLCRFGPGGQ